MTNIHIFRQFIDVRSISRQSNPLWIFQPIFSHWLWDVLRWKMLKESEDVRAQEGPLAMARGSGKRPLLEEFACTQRATGLRNGPGLALWMALTCAQPTFATSRRARNKPIEHALCKACTKSTYQTWNTLGRPGKVQKLTPEEGLCSAFAAILFHRSRDGQQR